MWYGSTVWFINIYIMRTNVTKSVRKISWHHEQLNIKTEPLNKANYFNLTNHKKNDAYGKIYDWVTYVVIAVLLPMICKYLQKSLEYKRIEQEHSCYTSRFRLIDLYVVLSMYLFIDLRSKLFLVETDIQRDKRRSA